MNPKYYSLPEEKQRRILNAGFHVFAKDSYKKSSMQEIADKAGISKSLLFHYFKNKKELYLFLFDSCCAITVKKMEEGGTYEQKDLFASIDEGTKVKMALMKEYPDMAVFAIRAFYEDDPEVSGDVKQSMERYLSIHARRKLEEVDPEEFKDGIDLKMMYKEMYWASQGYLFELLQQGKIDFEKMEEDYKKLLAFWKSVYLRKDEDE